MDVKDCCALFMYVPVPKEAFSLWLCDVHRHHTAREGMSICFKKQIKYPMEDLKLGCYHDVLSGDLCSALGCVAILIIIVVVGRSR